MSTVVVEEKPRQTTAKKIAFSPESLRIMRMPYGIEKIKCPYCGQEVEAKVRNIPQEWWPYENARVQYDFEHCGRLIRVTERDHEWK
jgi:copper chaperone CopZ